MRFPENSRQTIKKTRSPLATGPFSFVGVADYLPSVGDPDLGNWQTKKDLPTVGFFLLSFSRL